MMEKVRVRFAPSPTGALHIGGAHTALFNWLWARRMGGRFVLRIEDTDRQRSTKEFERTILAGMNWLGLDWDEGPDCGGGYGPYRQSERLEIYRGHAETLLKKGLAYREGEAIVHHVPQDRTVRFDDIVYGTIEIKSETIKDTVLIKSDGTPTYNFAVVVDDYTMAINYVIRGEDHIINTPKQILLYEALGWELPRFAHLPMILGEDKKKLSKRQGATSVYDYRDLGYIPEGIFNFLALLGWSAGEDREIFDREEATSLFDLRQVAKRKAVFDMKKLGFVNQEHLKRLAPSRKLALVEPFWKALSVDASPFDEPYLLRSLDLLEGRGQTLEEMARYSDFVLSFEPVKARYDGEDLDEPLRARLRPFFEALTATERWDHDSMAELARLWAAEEGMKLKDLAMPLRWALTGRKVSPGIFEVAVHLGREEVRRRLRHYGLLPR